MLLLLFVVLLLAACSPPPELRDDSFLSDTSLVTGEPCEAPCWQNITPGETSWNDALTILEDDARFTDLETVSGDNEDLVVNFAPPDGRQCCRMYSEDGQTVDFILTLLAPEMTVGEVIERYGEPAFYQGEDITADQTFMSLLYPDTQLVVYVFGDGIEIGELTADSDVIGASYLTADDMTDLMRANDLYAWTGYGTLSTLFDRDFDQTAVPPEQLDADSNSGLDGTTDEN
jgi:hypothetical protein